MFNSTLRHETDLSEISFSSALIALMLFLSYILGRIGAGDIPSVLPLCLSISILVLPEVLRNFISLSTALLQVIVLLFFFLLGWLAILVGLDLSAVLYGSCILTLWYFFKRKIFFNTKKKAAKIMLFIFLSFALVYQVWTQDYMNPLSPEAFAAGFRFAHVDTLFLASITATIKNYKIASTGLYGLEPISYHTGSNYLFASFSKLCRLSAFEFYNFAYPIIFLPLFIQSLMYAAYANLRMRKHSFRIIICYTILFFLLTGIFSTRLGRDYLLPTTIGGHIVSQSYGISLILMFLAIGVFSGLLMNRRSNNAATDTWLILTIPIWFFAIGFVKISTALVLFPILIWLAIRTKRILQKPMLFAVIMSSVILYLVLQLTVETGSSAFNLQLGSYYKTFVKGSTSIYFLLHYFPLLLLVLVFFLVIAKSNMSGISRWFLSKKYLALELIAVGAITGIGPGLLFYIEGGSAYYFSDIQYWLTAVALLHFTPYLIYKKYSWNFKWRQVIRIASFALVIIITREAVFRSYYYYIKKNFQIRTSLVYGNETNFKSLAQKKSLGPLVKSLTVGLSEETRFQEQVRMLNIPLFQELRSLPDSVKSKGLIYCEDPSQVEKFLRCEEGTFYISAMSEMALANGLYWAKDCHNIRAYGMQRYANFPSTVTLGQAISFALEKNFGYLILINLEKGTYNLRKL